MLNKLKKLISKINMSMMAFMAFSIRIIMFGSTIGDSIAIVALSGIFGYSMFLHNKDKKRESMVESDLSKLKQDLDSIKNKVSGKVIYETNKKREPVRRY
ncbi:MAG: hypothetical protein COB41_00295 [Proteobacteria bacterium]|nr:MAG: hypothetical protein COB41_00295 [Pseudomonadota bacterium]